MTRDYRLSQLKRPDSKHGWKSRMTTRPPPKQKSTFSWNTIPELPSREPEWEPLEFWFSETDRISIPLTVHLFHPIVINIKLSLTSKINMIDVSPKFTTRKSRGLLRDTWCDLDIITVMDPREIPLIAPEA